MNCQCARIGGLSLASAAPGKNKERWFRDYLVTQVKKQGLKIKLGVDVSSDMADKINPDVINVATGETSSVPDIPGIRESKVTTAWDVLKVDVNLKEEEVVILGGGVVGCETAEYLAGQGKTVTVIEMLPKMAHAMEPLNRHALIEEVKKLKITLLTAKKR